MCQAIEALSKLKAFLRKAAARTIDDLWDEIRDAVANFTLQDCANYSPQPDMSQTEQIPL